MRYETRDNLMAELQSLIVPAIENYQRQKKLGIPESDLMQYKATIYWDGKQILASRSRKRHYTKIIDIHKDWLELGMTARAWEKALAKTAAFLEKRGHYPDRHKITDKTGKLFT